MRSHMRSPCQNAFTKWLPPWRKGRISCLWIKSVFDCLTIGIIHETMVVHMTWVWTFFNNYVYIYIYNTICSMQHLFPGFFICFCKLLSVVYGGSCIVYKETVDRLVELLCPIKRGKGGWCLVVLFIVCFVPPPIQVHVDVMDCTVHCLMSVWCFTNFVTFLYL